MREILILSQLLPVAHHNGGSTQIRNILISLKRKNYITDFVSFNLPHLSETEIDDVKQFLTSHTRTHFIVPFLGQEITPQHYSHRVESICHSLSNRNYTAVFAEFLSMGRYLRSFRGCKRFISLHELNSLRQVRESILDYKIQDRLYLIFSALKSLTDEIQILREADVVLSYNEIEVELLKCLLKKCEIQLIPLTVESKKEILPLNNREYDFLFFGNYGHKPNRDSAYFIINNYKLILGNHTLLLGGRDIHLLDPIINHIPQLKRETKIKTPEGFFNKGKILLAPVLSGGGGRVKIIDAMSAGNIVITTKIGAEGLNNEERESIFILSKQELLSGKVIEILTNLSKHAYLSTRCITLAETFHNIDESIKIREYYFY